MSTVFVAAQIQAMKEHGGLILNICSAYGFIPNMFEPIYATSKGWYSHSILSPNIVVSY